MPTGRAGRLAVSGALVLALLVTPSGGLALSCATPSSEPFAGARQLVAGTSPWEVDGLLIGTIASIETAGDGTPVRTLVVEPEVVFTGPIRGVVRPLVGPFGPDMSFSPGGRYFLVLQAGKDPAGPDWTVDPCLPSMEITSSSQLQELRDLDADAVVIREPNIPPASLPAVLIASIVALAGWRVAVRRDRQA
jgi:hypothetical protein